MSHSSLWNVYGSKVTYHSEYHNGHGSAPPVWGYLCVHHLGEPSHWWLGNSGGNVNKMWDLHKDETVPKAIRFALLWTFDYAVVPVDKLGEAAGYCDEVAKITYHSEYINHWSAFAVALRAIETKHDYRLLGVGLGCTSVSDPYEYVKHKDMGFFDVMKSLTPPPPAQDDGAK